MQTTKEFILSGNSKPVKLTVALPNGFEKAALHFLEKEAESLLEQVKNGKAGAHAKVFLSEHAEFRFDSSKESLVLVLTSGYKINFKLRESNEGVFFFENSHALLKLSHGFAKKFAYDYFYYCAKYKLVNLILETFTENFLNKINSVNPEINISLYNLSKNDIFLDKNIKDLFIF